MTTVDFDAATRFYPGTTKPAVDRLTLHVDDGEFLVLVRTLRIGQIHRTTHARRIGECRRGQDLDRRP